MQVSARFRSAHGLLKKSVEKGGNHYDSKSDKNRYNGNYNGFQNYHYLVVGCEESL